MKSKESVFNEAKAGEKCYADSQGWLDTEEWADDAKLKHLEEFAKEIRANADAFVLIGVGGSNNAARSVVEALREDGAPEIIYAGNTLSPDALNRMMKNWKENPFILTVSQRILKHSNQGLHFGF